MPDQRYGNQRLRRRPARQDPRKRILVVVEGTVTEAGYFQAIKREIRTELLTLDINHEGGVPKTLVERAVRLMKDAKTYARNHKDDWERYDEAWCVHDVDEHPKLPEARQQAEAHGIQLAISNPSFELWALLHFEQLTSYQARDVVRALLQNHLPWYNKELDFRKLHRADSYFDDPQSAYYDARERAKQLDLMHGRVNASGVNPSTGVYVLTERIRELTRPMSTTI